MLTEARSWNTYALKHATLLTWSLKVYAGKFQTTVTSIMVEGNHAEPGGDR